MFCVIIHEVAHAWAADRLGDPTARIYGRLTLNPLPHIDLFGTIILPVLLMITHSPLMIGWAKPVPFNPENLRNPKRDSVLIALAGPLSNLLTAFICAIPLKYLSSTAFVASPIYGLIGQIFWLSIVLFSLNILPFPPLDGSKIIGVFVPHKWYYAYQNYLNEGVKYVIIFILFDIFVIEKILGYSLLNYAIVQVTKVTLAIISLGTWIMHFENQTQCRCSSDGRATPW